MIPIKPLSRSRLRAASRITVQALTLLACSFPAMPTPGHAQRAGQATLEVLVTTAEGQPLAGADVVVARLADSDAADVESTNPTGQARFSGLAAGNYAIRIEALGSRSWEGAVEVPETGSVAVTARLAESPLAMGGLVVEAARTSAPVSTLPTAVTVVGQEALGLQASVAAGLNGSLAKVVPGLSASTGTSSMFGQTFRGRNLFVLIDGVPQSTSRNVMRDLETLDPSSVERVEVLRGATALYGDGATGGVINIITRTPGLARRYHTAVSVESATADVGEGSGVSIEQSAEGRQGPVDYLLSASLSSNGAFFDGEGDRTPPDPQGQGGFADYRTASFLGKVGASFGDRRAELSVQRYDGTQDTEFTTDPSVNAEEIGTAKARAVSGLDIDGVTGTDNLNVIASYRDHSVLGGQLRIRTYLRDYQTKFGPFDGRSYIDHVAQSFVDSRKVGARIEHEEVLDTHGRPEIVWGLDWTREQTFQGLNLMDPDVYDASGGRTFQKIGEARWVPEIVNRSLGVFAQVGWTPLDRLSLRGGIRQELARVDVDDFTTVTGNPVEGGALDYSPMLLNVGAVLEAGSSVELFASYAQGFSLADIGRVLRGAPAGFTLGARALDAQLVDHYEIGARAELGPVHASASTFYNESDLGTNFNAELEVVRAPERIRGFEGALDARIWDGGSVGGTFTWSEGESYNEAADEWLALNGFRIQPEKTTVYVEHRDRAGWFTRAQLLVSGSRDRAFEDGLTYGHLPVEGYTIVDWVAAVDVGPGRLDLGVQNVLDELYFPTVAQLYAQWGNSSRAAGRGRTVSLGYSIRY